MKKPRFGGEGRSSREAAEREAQDELNRLARQSGPPPSRPGDPSPSPPPPARSSYSRQRESYTSTGAVGSRTAYVPPARPAGAVRPIASAPSEARSPGMSSGMPLPDPDLFDEDEEFEDEGDWEDDDPDEIYHGPRSAREEEEAVTGLALRDWAAGRGQPDRMEDFALPRLDAGSIEAQRDRALREIVERQERMRKEYREQKSHLQPVDGGTEISDVRAAHQMNVLRRGKPPGMMNMAAVQTGNLNRQRTERLARADELAAAAPAPARSKRAAAPAARTAKKAVPASGRKAAASGRAAAPKAAAGRSATKAAPKPATASRAGSTKAAPKAPAKAAARTAAAKAAAKAAKPAKAPAPKFVRKAAPATKAAKAAKPAARTPRRGSSG